MVKLFNGHVAKTKDSESFQIDNMYVPIGTRTFANQLESACANDSTSAFMPREDRKRIAANAVNDNHVKHHLKYLFPNTSAKHEDEIYPVTVSDFPQPSRDTGFIRNILRTNLLKVTTRQGY